MTKSRRIAVMAVLVFEFVLVAAIVIGAITLFSDKNREFTVERWEKSKNEKRYQYIESLEEKYELEGMSRSEVEELLGSPSHTEIESGIIKEYEYRIADDVMVGWRVYRILFTDEIVMKAKTDVEDW
ncbi:hypothetical protein M2145_002518 [Lachnospiraceae bacterium PF1-21]